MKKENIINTKTKKCNEKNCSKRPSFNFINEKKDYIVQNIKKKI